MRCSYACCTMVAVDVEFMVDAKSQEMGITIKSVVGGVDVFSTKAELLCTVALVQGRYS